MQQKFRIECAGKIAQPQIEVYHDLEHQDRMLVLEITHDIVGGIKDGPAVRAQTAARLHKTTLELHERIVRAIAESGFYLGEIETTGL